jgi:hypothetical protein
MSTKRDIPTRDRVALEDFDMAGAPAPAAPSPAPATAGEARAPGFFRRLVEAMGESRRRQAEAEIARYFGRTGGVADEAGRKLSEALLRGRTPR